MNRLIPVTLVLLAVGCSGQPPASTPSASAAPAMTSEQAAMLANGKRLMASLPKDFRAELVSAEFRGVKLSSDRGPDAKGNKTLLVITVRCSNGDDTLDTSGWAVYATANDEFGNTVAEAVRHDLVVKMSGEPNEMHDIPPGKSALRTFVFDRPIPKATSIELRVGVSFPKRPSEIPFGVTVKVPLPPAK